MVLYEVAVPVASINVCFSCGDIMLWPRWEPAPDWEHLSAKQTEWEGYAEGAVEIVRRVITRSDPDFERLTDCTRWYESPT